MLYEPPVPGVVFYNNLLGTQHTTRADGVAVITDLVPDRPIQVQIDQDNLPDPYVQPAKPDVVVLGHSGARGAFEFPFSQLGEMSGMLRTSGSLPGLVTLRAVGNNPANSATTVVAPDGYFVLGPMPLDTYQVHISKPQGYQLTGPKNLTLTAKNPFIENLEWRLQAPPKLPKKHTASPTDVLR
jgi:hypothetical protein